MSEKRNYTHFTKDERNELSILLKRGYSHKEIADVLEKNRSSISREIKRGKRKNGIYDPRVAHHKAYVKRLRSKYQGMKVNEHPELKQYIEEKIQSPHHWTPEQIAGRWNTEEHTDQQGNLVVITAKSIYAFLYSPYGQYLCTHLPSKRYRPKKRLKKKGKQSRIPNRVLIDERPDSVDSRTEFGHLEGDTMGRIRGDSEAIAGLVERMSRKVMITKVSQLKYAMDGFKERLNPYHDISESLTLDNGVENVRWEELGIPTYFCHPYSSWEKGAVENAFLRLRRFIPKKSSLRDYTYDDIKRFEDIMNNTPRRCLGWKTPNEVFDEHILKVDSS